MSTDISHTVTAKSDQLNAADLIGGPVTVSVVSVNILKGDQPVSILITGGHQPFKPCLTVRRILAKLWTTDSSLWVGRSMTLYCDETVMWAGEMAGGIRVSHLSNIGGRKEVTVRASKHKIMKHVIEPILSYLLPEFKSDLSKAKTLQELNEKAKKAIALSKSEKDKGRELYKKRLKEINKANGESKES